MTLVYQKHVSTQGEGLWTTEIIWAITTRTRGPKMPRFTICID